MTDRLDELLTDVVHQARYLVAHEIIRNPRALPQAQWELWNAKFAVRSHVTETARAIRHIAEELAGTQGTWHSLAAAIHKASTALHALAEEMDPGGMVDLEAYCDDDDAA